jgi:hypothetical protein
MDNKPSPTQTANASEPSYDISVSLSSGTSLEQLQAHGAGLLNWPQEKVDTLVQALKGSPSPSIGKGIPKSRAEKIRQDFENAGLSIKLTPVLELMPQIETEYDSTLTCPGCSARVTLTAQRQCPACGIFVDKIAEEEQLRRRIEAQERQRAEMALASEARISEKRKREEIERRIRDEIRREMEHKYNIKPTGTPTLSRYGRLIRVAAVASLTIGSVAIGRYSHNIPGLGGQLAANAPKAPIGQTGLGQGAGNGAGSNASGGGSAAANDQNIALAMEKGLPPQASVGPDGQPLDEETLLKLARNGGGGPGISLDQAVAASGKLASTVGNTTLERALSNGAGPTGTTKDTVGATRATQSPANTQTSFGDKAEAIPAEMRASLGSAFAVYLASIGQSARAAEVLASLHAKPDITSDPKQNDILQSQTAIALAFTLGHQPPSANGIGYRFDGLMERVLNIKDTGLKVQTLTESAVALSRPDNPASAAANWLIEEARNSATLAPSASRSALDGTIAVAKLQVQLNELLHSVQVGHWSQAQKLLGLLTQASNTSGLNDEYLAQVEGILFRAQTAFGNQRAANSALEKASALALQSPSVAARARQLAAVASTSRAYQNSILTRAFSDLEKTMRVATATEKLQVFGTLASYEARRANDDAASKWLQQAQQLAQSVSPQENAQSMSQIKFDKDVALIDAQRTAGAWSEAEAQIRRVARDLL